MSVVFVFVPDFFLFFPLFFVFFEDVSTEEEAVNTINDVLSELGLSETPAATEEGASSVKGCDSVQDPLCSLQMSETQSQSVDGTEPVMQAEDVPLQLLLEDKRKRKKQEDFDKKMAARLQKGSDVPESVDVAELTVGHCSVAGEDVPCGTDGMVVPVKKKIKKTAARKHLVGDVTPRRSPRVSKVVELAEEEGLALGGTPHHSPRVLATAVPTPSPLGAGASGKGKKCGVKRKVAPAKVNKGGKKRSHVNLEDKDDADFNANDEDDEDDGAAANQV